MKLMSFSGRVAKEIMRDPINICFGLGFPVVLLLLLSAIQANIPVDIFEIENLVPGINVFGMSFLTLFSAMLVAKDRESAFLQRLYTTPLRAGDFIFGYILPILPIAAAQSIVCYITACILGLTPTVNILWAVLFSVPQSLFFVAFGIFCGSVLGVKQASGLCGALFTNLSAWMSGTWFDLDLVGGIFKKIAYALPFVHSVEAGRAVFSGNAAGMLPHIWWVAGYTAAFLILAVVFFLRQMKRQ